VKKARSKKKHSTGRLIRDLLLIALSIVIAILVIKLGVIKNVLTTTQEIRFLGSFITGLFFTSLFTTPLSIVSFASIAQEANLINMAFWGALGAVMGDLVIFFFIRDSLAQDVSEVLKVAGHKRIFHIFKHRIFRWLTPLLGALIIASPFPDELGIAMMGFSRLKTGALIPISFVMNFIGILLIGLAATAVR
jgi:hypothetical protein